MIVVTFLGHILTDQGVEVDLKKFEAVKNWLRSINPKDIRGFLGLANNYCRCVEGFSTIAALLFNKEEGKVLVVWNLWKEL